MIDNKKPKSILKHSHYTSEDDLSGSNQSFWFSKLESSNSPRINNLFSFKKQAQQHPQQEDNIFNVELTPREIRRVRFPVADMTTEYLFKKEDILIDSKKQNKLEPIHIQTSGQLLSLYESNCRNKQEPTIDLLITTLTVSMFPVVLHYSNKKVGSTKCNFLN